MRNALSLTMVSCLVLAMTLPASAQQSDAAYCQALARKYQRYVGDDDARRKGQVRDARIDTAIARCSSDNAAAIPVLEQALKEAKIDLPAHGE